MIARDRELLVRLGQVNARLGEVVLALMAAQDGGELPADGLREVGAALCVLADDMLARAAELGGHILVTPAAQETVLCALCANEPVARPDQPHTSVDGRFCGGCIARCLDDTDHRHWCAVDTVGNAEQSTSLVTEVSRA